MDRSLEHWIVSEFGKKQKRNQVPIGSAYQANIPDLEASKNSIKLNLKNRETIFGENNFLCKKCSVSIRKLDDADIQMIKENILDQSYQQIFHSKKRQKIL
jgi:hypothetical protein